MPSSVDASAATGTTGRPWAASGPTCSSRLSLGAADGDDRGAGLGDQARRPSCRCRRRLRRRPRRCGRPGSASPRRPRHLSGQEMELCILQNTIPQRLSGRQGRPRACAHYCLDYSGLLTSRLMNARYIAPNPTAAEGWSLERVTTPSRLFGANGLRTGPDGRDLHRAGDGQSDQRAGPRSPVVVEPISAKGGDIVAPDDVAFAPDGDALRHRGDGRPGQRAGALTAGRGYCATTCRAPTASPCTRAGCSSTNAATAAV